MRKILFIAIALIGLSLLACSDDDPVTPRPFKVTINIVDDTGAPVEGLLIGTTSDNPYLQDRLAKRKAAVRIEFSSLNDSDARLAIQDIEGTEIRVLFEESVTAGRYTLAWDGKNDKGVRQASGFYTAHLVLKHPGTEAVVYEDTEDMLMCLLDPRRGTTGVTDANGSVILTDKRLFPHLYDPPVISARDEGGEFIGFLELTPSMIFTVADTVAGRNMSFVREVTGSVALEFVWDPKKSDPIEFRPMATAATDTTNPEPVPNRLGPAYPIPFN